jgi:hypothetical protein
MGSARWSASVAAVWSPISAWTVAWMLASQGVTAGACSAWVSAAVRWSSAAAVTPSAWASWAV